MLYKKKKNIFSAMSAMADLALLLVVFFVASSSIQEDKVLSVDLPVAKVDSIDTEVVLYLSVSEDGIILFQNIEYTLETFESNLKIFSFIPEQYIALVADKNVSYAFISDIFKMLQDQDISNIVLVSTPKK